MKLEEVINAALVYLNETDRRAGADATGDEKIKLLSRCVNIMLTEIAQEYLPLADECEVTAENGAFGYEKLPRKVCRIMSVKDERGDKVDFRQRPFSCKVAKNGRLKVEYRYLPAEAVNGEDCDVDPAVSEKTLALGVCAEYCMINGMYEQSEGFAERFREDMRAAVRPVKSVILKERRWY